jgi:hypothetical protein
MCAHHDDMAPKGDRRHVKALLEKRLVELHRQEAKLQDSPLKSYYASQEAILEDVLRRAKGHKDDETLIRIIDVTILESLCYQKISTDRGLKSFYGIKIRVLRAARVFVRRYLHPKRWVRRKRK